MHAMATQIFADMSVDTTRGCYAPCCIQEVDRFGGGPLTYRQNMCEGNLTAQGYRDLKPTRHTHYADHQRQL